MIGRAAAGVVAVVRALAMLGGLAGCGKKGRLEVPPDSEKEYPRTYPHG